jgi:hypothetical protein
MFLHEDPVISNMSPSCCPIEGGTEVSISGVGFDSTTVLPVDGVAVDFVLISSTLFTFTFTTVAHGAGEVPVIVDAQSEPDQGIFTYTGAFLPGSGFTGLLAAALTFSCCFSAECCSISEGAHCTFSPDTCGPG